MAVNERQRRYNASEKGRARKAAYRARHRERIREADNERYARERAERRARLDAIKLAAGCIDCRYADHPAALDFDHIGDDKVADVGRMVHDRVAWDLVLAEIAKCVVRCANCHRVKTAENREWLPRASAPLVTPDALF